MPTFSLTDNADNPVSLPVNWTQLSALFKYLRSEGLHLIVFPDFLQRKDQTLAAITPQPLSAKLKLGNKFQLGGTQPEIDVTPDAKIDVEVCATAGANLFQDDPFAVAATVPANTAYVGFAFEGSLNIGMSGSNGELTFGFDRFSDMKVGFWKAFPAIGPLQPTLGTALAAVISNYTIPSDLTDLSGLQPSDICTVSGTGSLKVSGAVKVKASPNPLASVNLPLNAGQITVQEGAMAGLSASFMIEGSYQIRVRQIDIHTAELSFLKQVGTTLEVDLSASAGVSVTLGDTDLLAVLLGAIDPKTDNTSLMDGGLTADAAKTLTDAIKSSIDQSLKASFDDALSRVTDDEAAFQYHIDLDVAKNDTTANDALRAALKGDLSLLTALENEIKDGGVLAPGVTMINSVFSTSVKKEAAFKLNLLGLLNVISLSDLIRGSKVIKDPVTGDLTITDSVTGTQIEAIVEPPKHDERLRKAMFDSLLVTAAYRCSGAVEAFALSTQSFHFALNQKTNVGIMTDYLDWLVALNLITAADKPQLLSQLTDQGPSTCLLRTSFTDSQFRLMFFDQNNELRPQSYYQEFGRRALMALLNNLIEPFDAYRYALLDRHWDEAVQTGPNPALAQLVNVTSATPNSTAIVAQLEGDIYDILWWASGMVAAGKALQAMNGFIAGRDPISLRNDQGFAGQRLALQKKLSDIVNRSQARFTEPWGLVSLFWAAGSQGASARIVTRSMTIVKP